jgi:anti-anti-sigma factor
MYLTPNAPAPDSRPLVLSVSNRQVREVAARAADCLDGGDVRLDFAGVDYVNSRELGALVVLNRKVKASGGRLALVNVGPFVAGVFDVTRLDTILDIRRPAGLESGG